MRPAFADRTEPDLLLRLKRETAEAHRRLEDDLGFAKGAITEARLRQFFAGLYGFLRVWEPWLTRTGVDERFLAPRRKLHLLEADLRTLGVNLPQRLPVYPLPLPHPRLEAAMGSLYVMEGSALGGVVIGKWLRGASWAPARGFSYFDCYGGETGPMWKQFQNWLTESAPDSSHDGVVDAAMDIFARLHSWLCKPEDQR